MAKVAQQNKVGLFAPAEAHAGLDVGVDVVSAEERQAAQAQAEMEAIYGTASSVDPNAGFAPPAYSQQPLSQASNQAAAEAAALLAGDENPLAGDPSFDSLVEDIAGAAAVAVPAPSASPTSVAEPSSGVALPPQVSLPATPSVSEAVSLPSTEPVAMAAVSLPETPPAVSQPAATAPPTPPAPTVVRHTCTSCSAVFEIDLPAGLTKALVACPSCGVDQTVVLGV